MFSSFAIYIILNIYTHTHLLSRFVSEETWHIFDFHRIRVQYVSELLSFSSIINEWLRSVFM